MNIIPLILGIVSGICAGIGLIYLFIGLRRRGGDRLHIVFAMFALAYGLAVATAALLYQASTVDVFLRAQLVNGIFTGFTMVFLLWFVAIYTDVRPRVFLVLLTSVYIVFILLNSLRPYGLASEIFSMISISLPWGEIFYIPDLGDSIWSTLFFFIQLISIGFLFYAIIRQVRRGERKEALTLGAGLVLMVLGLIFDFLIIDSGLVSFIYPSEFGFLPLAVLMSIKLANDVIRTEEELATYQYQLEDLVEERTSELKSSNDRLALEIKGRENLEMELRKSERTARALLNAPNDSAMLLDPEGAILDINEVGADRLGVIAADVKGTNVYDLLPPDLAEYRGGKLQELINTGNPVSWEDERGGRVFDNNMYPILDDKGRVASIAVYATDITERKAAEVREIETAATEERGRLARDLHDAVTQTIYSASLIAESLPIIWERNPDEGRRNLAKLRQLVRGALAEMRSLLFELRPSALEAAELGVLLSQLCDVLTGRTQIPVEREIDVKASPPLQVKVAVYRITQEILNNIAKHSDATLVELWLVSNLDQVSLTIRDNGRGFDPEAVTDGRLGLGILRERADEIDARLEVSSAPGKGTRIAVNWESPQTENNS